MKLPSVTTILDLAYQKEWMRGYIAKQMAEEAVRGVSFTKDEFLEALEGHRREASDHGDDIHARLNTLGLGGESKFGPIEEWNRIYQPDIIYTEAQVYNLTIGYAGSLDIIAYINGKLYLIDLKTGMHLDSSIKLQLSAYKNAEYISDELRSPEVMPEIDACGILWIPRNTPEDWSFREVNVGNREFKAFLSCVDIANYHIANSSRNVLGKIVEHG